MKHLYVAAAPEVRAADRRRVRDCLGRWFDEPVRELALPAMDFAYDVDRGQYSSIAVLELLLRLLPEDARKVVAVTERDLFVPVLTFVFGLAQLNGQVAVVSLARLRQEFYGLPANPEVFSERARKETLHEAGHLFGLVHCTDRSCAMSLATNVRQIDAKSTDYCAACATRLRQAREKA